MSEQTTGYTAEDMADQAASQFRAGYESAKRGDPAPAGDDFDLPAKACDLSGEGACEACQ